MKITKTVILKNYREILKQNTGAEFMKVDLHIHTPASGDAQFSNRYSFKYDIKDIPESLAAAKVIAGQIIDATIQKGIRLIAVTDHNSPSNTHPEDLTNTWYQLLTEKAKGKDLCILPGVEISTDDLHILVILDAKEDEPAAFTTHRINFLLQDCKFSLKDYGDYKATGMSSLFDVLQYLEDLSTDCITIPAHIDGGKKAMLASYRNPSNVYNKLLNHPNLNAVEVVKDTTPDRKKIGDKSVRDFFAYKRSSYRSSIAFIQDSDSHSIPDIGKRFTYVRMGKPGYWSLKNALENPETRIRMEKDYKPDNNKTRILGMVYSTGSKWKYIAFNSNLNCIIGRKKTKKSLVLDLILYGLDRLTDKEKDDETAIIREGYWVNVFIAKGSEILCYSRNNQGDPLAIYKNINDSFVLMDTAPEVELPRRYEQSVVEEIFADKIKLMDFLDCHLFMNENVRPYLNRRDQLLVKKQVNNNILSNADSDHLISACDQIFNERKNRIKSVLKQYGKQQFSIRINKGKYTGPDIRDYYDKPAVSVKKDSKYIPLPKLPVGEKNAAVMILLMNQGAFGPLIIDEPEQYLDVKSITRMLAPRLRELKTQQQIICVTRNEYILFSGDADQVIVTQSEEELNVVTGDINDGIIQELLLEIFEGDKYAFKDKVRKLEGILE